MEKTPLERIGDYSRFGSRLGLARMEKLMKLLGNPEKSLRVIHVAGTNGKGSVCRYIYEVLIENGYSTGLYISPYLQSFNERMESNKEYVTDEELKRLTDQVLEKAEFLVESGEEPPTEFEIVTAMAFLWFKEKNNDFIVLEVGLGGSGDSTNVIEKPLITVITSISYDHMDRLGSRLEDIASEKAGIIKSNVPVVINVTDEGSRKVIAKKAYRENAPLYDVTKFKFDNSHHTIDGQSFNTKIDGIIYEDVQLSMLGLHQINNAMTSLTVLSVLRKEKLINITKEKLYKGMKRAVQPGRFEVMGKDPYIILDGAHNRGGAESLEETMEEFFKEKEAVMVVGILADKEVDIMLDHFERIADSFITTEPPVERAMDAVLLEKKIRDRGKKATAIKDMEKAYYEGLKEVLEEGKEVLLIGGSLYLVGKIREMIENGSDKK